MTFSKKKSQLVVHSKNKLLLRIKRKKKTTKTPPNEINDEQLDVFKKIHERRDANFGTRKKPYLPHEGGLVYCLKTRKKNIFFFMT